MSRLGPSLVIAAALAAAGCDDRSDVASCTISGSADAGVAQTTCWELSGLTAESRHVFSDSCFVSTAQFGEDATARLAYAPCPRAGALGVPQVAIVLPERRTDRADRSGAVQRRRIANELYS